MTGNPVAQIIPRRGCGTRPPEGLGSTDAADWNDVREILHRGEVGPFWLSVGRDSDTMRQVFQWPTRVADDRLDADYGAPTSGGPPYQVYALTPVRAYGFPTRDEVAPTRWVFDD